MAVKTSWSSGDVLTAADLTDTFASKLDTPGAWTTWTPVWTNLSVGNGIVTARYNKVGRNVFGYLQINLGSTSTVTGDVNATLPYANALASSGAAYFADAGVGNYLGKWIVSGGSIYFRAQSVSGSYLQQINLSSTVPFTWTTNDQMMATFMYESSS